MNMRIHLTVFAAFASAALFAQEKRPATMESTPVSRIETRNKNLDRGILGDYWWANRLVSRHNEIEKMRGKVVDLVLLGDSIMHFWEQRHPESWKKLTENRTVLNLGYAGDRTQHVLWRINNGELDGYKAKCVVLMIGTNNNSFTNSNPENVAVAIGDIVEKSRQHQPEAKIVLHPIFPRGSSPRSRHAEARVRNDKTNELLKKFAERDGKIVWMDFSDKLVDDTGWVPNSIMSDEIHPTSLGYDIWMETLEPVLTGSLNVTPMRP